MNQDRVLRCWSLLNQFRFDRNFDLIADDHSAGFGQSAKSHSEVLAIDFRRRRYSSTNIAPGVFYGSGGAFDVKGDLLSDAANREIASQLEIVRAESFNTR